MNHKKKASKNLRKLIKRKKAQKNKNKHSSLSVELIFQNWISDLFLLIYIKLPRNKQIFYLFLLVIIAETTS